MITLNSAVQCFLHAKAADGLSPSTLIFYEGVLKPVAARFGELPLDQVDTDQMRDYVLGLRTRSHRYENAPKRQEIPGGLAEATIDSFMRGLRAFWSWCSAEYGLTENPMRRIRKLPAQRKTPKAVASEDLRRLLDACADTASGLRDKAMLAFLTETGCRAGGLLSLTMAQLDLAGCQATVKEKGNKTRPVFFTPYTADLLRAWLAVRPLSAEQVFCSLRKYELGAPLGNSGLNQALKRLARKAGVTGRVNPHSFRHSFAREYLRNGGDLATLAQLMGHSDVAVTAMSYAIFTDNELSKLHEQHGPHIEALEARR